jgi:hypothetical protein
LTRVLLPSDSLSRSPVCWQSIEYEVLKAEVSTTQICECRSFSYFYI